MRILQNVTDSFLQNYRVLGFDDLGRVLLLCQLVLGIKDCTLASSALELFDGLLVLGLVVIVQAEVCQDLQVSWHQGTSGEVFIHFLLVIGFCDIKLGMRILAGNLNRNNYSLSIEDIFLI